ncbi:MAG TPA: hypothetical protein VEL78_09200 [Pyrinomonadaceae bacterium]|nr:hypothetical protein [Pyrinomonadaceae bacterium]
MNTWRKKRLLLLIAIAILSLTTARAQSGRRSTGGSTTSAPSVSGPKPVEKKPTAAPKLQLLVGINRNDVFTTTPFYIYDTVLDNCIRRLGEAEIVLPTSAGNNMNRAEAIKAAKQETIRWVVSLEVRSVYADSGKQVKNNADELYVDYTVIEPETGKIKRSGRTHQTIYQTGRGGVSSPSKNSPLYSEYAIKQAAREAADRILAGFDIKVREDWPD